MNFGEAIKALKEGRCVRRIEWDDIQTFIVKQISQTIEESENIDTIKSLPKDAKALIKCWCNKQIKYNNQILIIKPNGKATSWLPTSDDIFAEDWKVIEFES